MKRVSTSIVKFRIRLLLICFTIFVVIMLIRLAYVQFVLADDINEKAVDLWLRNIAFQPDRGNILDMQGRDLTTNKSAASVIIVPQQVTDKEETAQQLATILQVPFEQMLEEITKQESSVRLHPEGRKITEEQETTLKQLKLPGVYLAKDSKRVYPHGNYLAHVLGFTGIDNQGLTGLELVYYDLLKGKSGSLSYFSDAKGGRIPYLENVYEVPTDGLHLQTTIDLDIQTIVERELTNAIHKYEPEGAMAIVVNPKTGAVLA